MAVNETSFKKGVSGNPAGRPIECPELREARALTKKELQKIFDNIMGMSMKELIAFSEDLSNGAVDLTIARSIVKSFETGDYKPIEFIFNRALGRPKKLEERDEVKPIVIKRFGGEEAFRLEMR